MVKDIYEFKGKGLEVTPLHKEYLDFLEIDSSFQGWLLTLSNEEILDFTKRAQKIINGDSTVDTELGTFILINNFGRLPKIGDSITEEQYDLTFRETLTSFILIGLIKQEKITYKVSKEGDANWQYKLTEKGKNYLEEVEQVLTKKKV